MIIAVIISKKLIIDSPVIKTIPFTNKNNPNIIINPSETHPKIPNNQKHIATNISNIPKIFIIMIDF